MPKHVPIASIKALNALLAPIESEGAIATPSPRTRLQELTQMQNHQNWHADTDSSATPSGYASTHPMQTGLHPRPPPPPSSDHL
jgi:hypothetical protein